MRYLQRAGFSPDAKRTLQGSCYDCTGQGRTRKRKVGGGVPVGGTEEPGWFVQLQALGHSVKRKKHICPWTEAEAGWGWARGKGTQKRRVGGAGRHSEGGWAVGRHHDWPKLPRERLMGGRDPEGRGLGRPPRAPRAQSPKPTLACLKLGVMVGHDKRGGGAGGPGGGTWPGSRAPPPALCSCLECHLHLLACHPPTRADNVELACS